MKIVICIAVLIVAADFPVAAMAMECVEVCEDSGHDSGLCELKCEIDDDPESTPEDVLAPAIADWCRESPDECAAEGLAPSEFQ